MSLGVSVLFTAYYSLSFAVVTWFEQRRTPSAPSGGQNPGSPEIEKSVGEALLRHRMSTDRKPGVGREIMY